MKVQLVVAEEHVSVAGAACDDGGIEVQNGARRPDDFGPEPAVVGIRRRKEAASPVDWHTVVSERSARHDPLPADEDVLPSRPPRECGDTSIKEFEQWDVVKDPEWLLPFPTTVHD